GDGHRGRHRGPRRGLLRDALVVRPVERADAADLRVRGGRDRWHGLALGHARRGDRARGRADRRRAERPARPRARRSRRLPDRAHGPRDPRVADVLAGVDGVGAMTDVAAPLPRPRVRRWTPVSVTFSSALAGLVGLLALVPVAMSENAMQKLTGLYILGLLAVMLNALAGHGWMVSVGQQAFIGLGAYGAIFLGHQHTVPPFRALLYSALIGGLVAIPVALVVLQLRGGAFAIGTWVVAEVF